MDVLGRGIIAGFLATLALSVLIDPLATAARMADLLPPALGWVLHFFVGSFVWGAAYALLQGWMRGPAWARGIVFGAAAWLVVMIFLMPLSRTGLFGLNLGAAAAIVMLVVHLIYGALLGAIFNLLAPAPDNEARRREHRFPDSNNGLHPLPR